MEKRASMKIQLNISSDMAKCLLEVQISLGFQRMEEVMIHAWEVLCFVLNEIRRDRRILSHEAVHWISQPTLYKLPPEVIQENPALTHVDLDRRILQEIHRLLDDDRIDQALKVTQIFKLIKSHTSQNRKDHLVKSEMLLTAAETFAAECDPEKATQLIIDASHETPWQSTEDSPSK